MEVEALQKDYSPLNINDCWFNYIDIVDGYNTWLLLLQKLLVQIRQMV
jgi:hypothetical protein